MAEDLSPILDQDIHTFIFSRGITNEKGEPLNFATHKFLWDIYKDMSPRQVMMKAAQIGATVMMTIKCLWIAKQKKLNIIYSMPSDSDIEEFVPSKVDKIIRVNPYFKKSLTTDKVSMKQIGDRFIHFKGTRSKSAPISTTADLLIQDELDRSDQKIAEFYVSRLGKSEYRGIWRLSNPSTFGNGVDLDWNKSDKKEWFISCPVCKEEQYLIWEFNVDEAGKRYICRKCGGGLTKKSIMKGQWKSTNPNPELDISGYHISQMMATWIPIADLIEQKSNTTDEFFYNFVLGLPYQPGDNPISRYLITDLLTNDELETGRYFLGVDVGNVKHYVLGSEKGIFEIGTFTEWDDLQTLINKYEPVTVIDSNPFHDIVKYFVKNNPNTYMSQFRYDKTSMETKVWGDKPDTRGIVYSDRNRIIDELVDKMLRSEFLISTRVGGKITDFIKHWLSMKKVKVENRLRIEKYEWESSNGVDHFALSTVYYFLAICRGSGSAYFSTDEKKRGEDQLRIERGWTAEEIGEFLQQNINEQHNLYG